MTDSKPSTSLQVTITVAPSNVSAFLAALKPCLDIVVAEPECMYFQVFQDPAKPGRFRLVEIWNQSKEWVMQEQLKKSYYDPYIEVTTPMWVEPRLIEFFEPVPGFCKGSNGT